MGCVMTNLITIVGIQDSITFKKCRELALQTGLGRVLSKCNPLQLLVTCQIVISNVTSGLQMEINNLQIIQCDFLDFCFRLRLSQLKWTYDKNDRPLHAL